MRHDGGRIRGRAYYTDDSQPLQQGDVVLAPLVRLESELIASPQRWQPLDQMAIDLKPSERLPGFTAVVGYSPAMVTTHDCHMDKEFILRVQELRKRDRLPLDEAEEQAEPDPYLDRYIKVSPLTDPRDHRADAQALRTNAVIGFFHVPERPDRGISESVVDLNYSVTIDRNTIVRRLAVLSERARTELRFALARADAFRTPEIGFELEDAVGKRIFAVRPHPDNPLIVVLELVDGSTIELVKQPAPLREGGIARSAPVPTEGEDAEAPDRN